MRGIRLTVLVVSTLWAARGGTIFDVSNQSVQTMNHDDKLYFLISNLSLPSVDTLGFQMASLNLDPAAQFAASVVSPDGSVTLDFGAVQINPGVMSSLRYSGPISAISGSLQLSGAQLFQNTRATLILRDMGGAVTVGLPPYTLTQDLTVSLSRGGVSAGAIASRALYEDPPPAGVPEPPSGLLAISAGVSLCLVARGLKRFSDRLQSSRNL